MTFTTILKLTIKKIAAVWTGLLQSKKILLTNKKRYQMNTYFCNRYLQNKILGVMNKYSAYEKTTTKIIITQ